MEVSKLEEHIRTLATVRETESPMISCYLEAAKGAATGREELATRFRIARKCLPPRRLADFDAAQGKIDELLERGLSPRTRGAAIFVRAGDEPFWLVLEFEAPLPTWVAVGSVPNIYHLVELKDNYDRYAILLVTEKTARIIGVNLGSVTAQLWRSRPELRARVGREWTKDHYQDHRRERTRQFIHDQVRGLDRLLAEAGYNRLILAGNPRLVADVRKALPKRIAEKVIDFIPAGRADHLSDIVASTLEAFLAHEELESQAIAEKLVNQLKSNGLAVAGPAATMDALRAGQADTVVIAQNFELGVGWECRNCGVMRVEPVIPDVCPSCRTARIREFEVRGELAQRAEQRHIPVEIVEHSDALLNLGGVGCLLRYAGPANHMYTAA